MYPVGVGSLFLVQHTCTGTGGFDGATEYGRASVLMVGPSSTGNVMIRAKRYGAAPNAYTIQFLDPGAGITNPVTAISQVGTAIVVTLRRDSIAGILATADEVALAINTFSPYTFPIVADATSATPTVVQAVVPTSLAGGIDPTTMDLANLQFKSVINNANSGVFLFENFTDLIQIRKFQFHFNLSVSAHLKVQTVNLTNGLGLIASDVGPIIDFDLTVSVNDYAVTDLRDPLLPYQGILVQCLDVSSNPQPGIVRIYAERMGNALVL